MSSVEKKRARAITGWRQVHRKPGISSRRLPASQPVIKPRPAPSDPAASERSEDEGGTLKNN